MDRRSWTQTSFQLRVAAFVEGRRLEGRAIEMSPTGMVCQLDQTNSKTHLPAINKFEISIGESTPIFADARTVWSDSSTLAVRFVTIDDADRLSIAEMLDAANKGEQFLEVS